jgi:hypothetical protein
MKGSSLGTMGNSIAGILGGGIGGQLLATMGVAAASGGGMDLGSIIASIAGGGVGGGVESKKPGDARLRTHREEPVGLDPAKARSEDRAYMPRPSSGDRKKPA